jgi:hypothetical protein
MSRTNSRWIAATALLAAGAMHYSIVAGQTPEEQKQWEAQRAQMQVEAKAKADLLAQQRAARRADPMSWVRTLDPMSAGGWVFKTVASDGSWATYSTDHQFKRSGHQVTAWVRQEFPEAAHDPGGDGYMSSVEKVQYDCTKAQAKVLLIVYYSGNNLTGSPQSQASDPKEAAWDPIVPGTQSEAAFHWACGSGSAGSRP